MYCPTCLDEYEDDVLRCAECGTALVPAGHPVPHGPALPEAHLGSFHPAVASGVVSLLDRRGVGFEVRERDDEVEILVDRAWRDDLRAELTLTWGDLLGGLDATVVGEVLATGGAVPGWYDPPHGGHVDRAGRLVVELDAEEEHATDASRMLGPALVTLGAVLVVVGWQVLDSAAVTVAGVALALLGVLTPR